MSLEVFQKILIDSSSPDISWDQAMNFMYIFSRDKGGIEYIDWFWILKYHKAVILFFYIIHSCDWILCL